MEYKKLILISIILMLSNTSQAQNILNIQCYYNTKGGINGLYAADVNGDGKSEIIAASYDGYIYLLDTSCKKIWDYYARCPAQSAFSADINEDGSLEILGGNCQHLLGFNYTGERILRYQTGEQVKKIIASDVNGDGVKELVIGSENPSGSSSAFTVIKGDGENIYSKTFKGTYLHGLTTLDVNEDGSEEIICGTGSLAAYNSLGEQLWSTKLSGNAETVSYDDVDSDGRQDILVGARRTLEVFDKSGHLLWSYETNGTIENVISSDINADDKKEVLASSDKLYVLNNRGELLWSYDTKSKVHMALADDLDSDGTVEIVIGGDMIYVLDSKGTLIWKYRTYRDVTGLQVDKGEGTILIASALDRNVYVFKAEPKKIPDNPTQPSTTATTETTTTQPLRETTTTTSMPPTTTQPKGGFELPTDNVFLILLALVIALAIIYFITERIKGVR